ncbi:Kelch repeat-containing protein [[Eubacterium] cellulosolvens]
MAKKILARNRIYARRIIVIIILALLLAMGFTLTQMKPEANATSTWTVESEADFCQGATCNTTVKESGATVELRLELGWMKTNAKTGPVARQGHAMAPISGTSRVLLFGGSNGGDESWIYNFTSSTWSKLLDLNKPSIRSYHAMAPVYTKDKVVLFGGWGGGGIYHADTWVFNGSDNKWINKNPMGSKPSARSGHIMSAIYGARKVLLFGGNVGMTAYDDTWLYDIEDNTWRHKIPADHPGKRWSAAMAYVNGTNKVVLFGGLNAGWKLSDTWIYDLNDNTWTAKFPQKKPTGRCGHSMTPVIDDDKVLMFGGNDGTSNSETWVYDLSDNTWTELKPTIKPNPRNDHAMVAIYKRDKHIIFGGFDGSKNLNDTWEFHYNQYKTGFFVSPCYDAGSTTAFKTISWDANMPPEASIRFQIRTTATEAELCSHQFVGPDGSAASYYTESPAELWSGHSNHRWVQFKAYLSTTNYDPPSLLSISLDYNRLPVTTLVSPLNGSILTDNKPLFTWEFNDPDASHQTKFQVLIDNESTFTDVDYDSNQQQRSGHEWSFPSGTKYSEMRDGKYYWKVHTKDSDGDWGDYSEPRVVIIDTTPPITIVTEPVNDGFYSRVNDIYGECTDGANGSGVNKVEVSIKRHGDDHYWDGTGWTSIEYWLPARGTTRWSCNISSATWSSGYTYSIIPRAMDNVENIELPGIGNVFTIDTELPISTIEEITNDSCYNDLDKISGTATDGSGSGIHKVELCIIDDGNNKYWDGKAWNYGTQWLPTTGTIDWYYDARNVSWRSDSYYIIHTKAVDNLGHTESPTAGVRFMVDNKPPEQLSISINYDVEYSNSTKVTVILQALDSGSGIHQVALGTEKDAWADWIEFNETKSIVLTGGEGERYVYFKARDYAGNVAQPVSDSIILDTSPPYMLSIVINMGDKKTESTKVSLNLSGTDDNSGVYKMSFSDDGINWTPWGRFTKSSSYTLEKGDGEKTIYFRVMDQAGNIAEPVSATITLESHGAGGGRLANDYWLYIVIIVVIFIIIISVAVGVSRSKSSKSEPSQTSIATSPTPIQSHTTTPTAQGQQLYQQQRAPGQPMPTPAARKPVRPEPPPDHIYLEKEPTPEELKELDKEIQYY